MKKGGALSPCQYSGIPLGGIGTGSVEIRDDGLFHQWQIMNNAPWGNGPATAAMEDEGFFFGLASKDLRDSRVLILSSLQWGDNDPDMSWESLRWTADPYHMPWTEYPSGISYEGRYPFASLGFKAGDFPVKVSLEAFSPFIPLDAKNSGLPAAYLTYTLKNVSRTTQVASLFGALKNVVGYDHRDNESVITWHSQGRASWCEFGRRGLPPGCQSAGSMALGAWASKSARASYILHAVHPRDIYDPVMETGRLEDLDRSQFRGSVGNDLGTGPRVRKADVGLSRGVLCQTLTLKPGETAQVTFVLAWHFPNQAQRTCRGGEATDVIGHQYANWFADATEVFRYCVKGFRSLRARSLEFVDAYYSSTAPKWVLDAAMAPLTNFAKSTWWDKAGRFAVWEGLGCCGLQTLDISLYGTFPVIQWFPELEKSQMRLVAQTAQSCGRPPHLFHGSLSCCGAPPNNRIDNAIQFILLAWRDALWTGDKAFVREIWPAVEIYLKDVAATDTDGDGLPNNAGVDQSYDQFPLFGTSAYVGLQYAGAMKAAARMASMIGMDGRARKLGAQAQQSLDTLEKQLWNGEYYNLSFDSKPGTGNAGCMADQLCGDWFVRQSDGTGLVSDERARSSLKAVFKYCMRGRDYLANCDWPRGGRVRIRRETSDQANCPWSGVELAVAAEMMLLGLAREGMAVLRGVYDRYDRFGMRYNHVECGTHYYRAMSSWAPYLALYGFAWDAERAHMTLAVPKREGRYVWCTPAAWGRYTSSGGVRPTITLEVLRGCLDIRSLRLVGKKVGTARIQSSGKRIACTLAQDPMEATVSLRKPARLGPGRALSVSLA